MKEAKAALVAMQCAQEEQTRLTHLTAKRETLNLKLSSTVNQLGHHRSTINVWITQMSVAKGFELVIDEQGSPVDVRVALGATRANINKLKKREEELMVELNGLAEEAAWVKGASSASREPGFRGSA